ncbi:MULTISPECIES: hypothetical protein [unclassified Agrobacterium]
MAAPRGAIGNHLFNIKRLRFDQRPLLSPKPDEDLTVIRAAASKVILAGRGQAARDLAEFAITIAGDRPERHSRALLTFADIYARLGMKTEALVALAAMLEISGDATWDQIWFESNLLFRMLRDAGMSHFGLPVLERSKEALCKADCCTRECGCHCSRLANPFFVAKPWLKGFITTWRSGDMLLDAYHKANLEVAHSSIWDPKRTLSMTLYGDSFVKGEYN